MRASDWRRETLAAWNGEPCPGCGMAMSAVDIDHDGEVWSFCGRCNKTFWTAFEPPPESFDYESNPDGPPF